MSAEQVTADDSDAHWLSVFSLMARSALELQCLAYMREDLEQARLLGKSGEREAKLLAEIVELKRDLARYENGRVVLLAELNAAKQLAMRQANQLRQLAGAAMRKQ